MAKLLEQILIFRALHGPVFFRFGDIGPSSNSERLAVATMYWCGFVLLSCLFVSDWSNVQAQKHRRKVAFFLKFRVINTDLHRDYRIPIKLREKVINFYLMYWRYKSAINKSSLTLLNVLPEALVKRISLDEYWLALKGSYIFQDLDKSLLRELSLFINTQLFQQGDIVFTHTMLRDQFVLIVKGMVHILAQMDDESPVLTLSAGTVLNELGLVVTSNSPATVCAATACEIQFLAKADFWRCMAKYTYRRQSYFVHRRMEVSLTILPGPD